jgi:hypothetical protein
MEVAGIRRYEVGEVERPSTYGDEAKKAVSDFIKRAAMRFGVALDLWAKEELEASAETTGPAPSSPPVPKQAAAPSERDQPASADGGPTPDRTKHGAPPNPSLPEVAPVASGGDLSSAAPNAAGTEAGGARQPEAAYGEGASSGEGSPQPPTSRDQLWANLEHFAGGRNKAVKAVNLACDTSYALNAKGATEVTEPDLLKTIMHFGLMEGVA